MMWEKLLRECVAAAVRFLDMQEGNAVERRFYFEGKEYSVSIKRRADEQSATPETKQ